MNLFSVSTDLPFRTFHINGITQYVVFSWLTVFTQQIVFKLCVGAFGCCCLVAKSHLTLLQPRGRQPGSSVHKISQARILQWVPFSRGSFHPRNQTCTSHITDWFLPLSHRFTPFSCQIIFQRMDTSLLFIHSSADGHEFFPCLCTGFCVYIVFIFGGYIPGCRIATSYRNSV